MQAIRTVSIRARMNAAMALSAATLVLLGAGGYLALERAQTQFASFSQQHLPLVVGAGKARDALAQLARFDDTDVVINYSMPSDAERIAAQWQSLVQGASQSLADMGTPINAVTAAVVRDARNRLGRYRDQVAPVMKAAVDGKLQSVAQGTRALEGSKQQVVDAEALLSGLAVRLDQSTLVMGAGIAARNAASSRALAIAVPVALLVLLPLMWVTMRSFLQPLVHARSIAALIAQGDLSVGIDDEGRDETADLMRSLRDMQESLRRLVGDIHASAGFVASASGEMAAANLDLSRRTESTAFELDAASSGMAQLSVGLASSAGAAREAGQLAVDAVEATRKGDHAVGAIALTMRGIEDSSARIEEIVEVVDGIARRTHILALNASVEAARVGVHGRGFAVVAHEVRMLALQVSDAAREIKALIEQSRQHVVQGGVRVQEAGATMGRVIASTQALSSVVQGIAASVSSQSQEMGRVNDAVTQLDRSAQHNSALVEQSAASAAGLRDQAVRLETLVGRFNVA